MMVTFSGYRIHYFSTEKSAVPILEKLAENSDRWCFDKVETTERKILEKTEEDDSAEMSFVPEEGAVELVEGYGFEHCRLEMTLLFAEDKGERWSEKFSGDNWKGNEMDYAYVLDDKLVLVRKEYCAESRTKRFVRRELSLELIAKLVQIVESESVTGAMETLRITVIDTGRKKEKELIGEENLRSYQAVQEILQ